MKIRETIEITRKVELTEQDIRDWVKQQNVVPEGWKFYSIKPVVDAGVLTLVVSHTEANEPKSTPQPNA